MTQALRIFSAAALVAVVTTATTAAQPQQQQTAPALPQLQTPVVDRYVVGRAKPPEVPGSQVIDLTLEATISLALEKNLNIQAAKLTPLLQDYQLAATRATFTPRFTQGYTFSDSRTISEQATEGVSKNITRRNSFSTGFGQSLPWYGMSFNTSWSNSRQAQNRLDANFSPQLNSGLNASFNMNLLRGFSIDNTRNSLRTAPISRLVADVQLQQTIAQTSTSVRNAYWALRQAIEQIEIAKLSLEMARRSLEDTKLRVEIGAAAPIDVAQPDLSVATAEQAQLNAEISWRNAELALKNLLVNGLDDELYRATINPVDVPGIPDQVPSVDIQAAMQAALSQRSDVIVSRRNLEISEMNFEVTKNNTLPTLGFSTSYSLGGTAGVRRERGEITSITGWSTALRQIATNEAPSFQMQFNFTYPLGMKAEKANMAQQQINLDRTRIQLRQQELTIQNEITRLGLNVDNTYRQLLAARKAREVAETNLEAELTRLNLGLSNNFTVAQVQERLTAQRLNELNALIRYINAAADFERAQKFPTGGGA